MTALRSHMCILKPQPPQNHFTHPSWCLFESSPLKPFRIKPIIRKMCTDEPGAPHNTWNYRLGLGTVPRGWTPAPLPRWPLTWSFWLTCRRAQKHDAEWLLLSECFPNTPLSSSSMKKYTGTTYWTHLVPDIDLNHWNALRRHIKLSEMILAGWRVPACWCSADAAVQTGSSSLVQTTK